MNFSSILVQDFSRFERRSRRSERLRFRNDRVRARSAELSRESYLSRWSRENTPVDSSINYCRSISRSFTPARESNNQNVYDLHMLDHDYRRSVSPTRSLSGIDSFSMPFHSNVNYYCEKQPLRKYDVFQLRSWAYPIWKHIHGRESTDRQRTYSRSYGLSTHYTPPMITPECHLPTVRRGYSGFSYVAGELTFDLTSRPGSLNSSLRRSTSHWNYYGQGGLRHFGSYRANIRSYGKTGRLY